MKREKAYDLIFIIIIIIFFLRAPQLIVNGRFWAEEGSYYFQYAYNHNFFETLIYVYEMCGYYYLWTNISVLFASLVPLEYAPAVATWLAFAMNVAIYAYIYYIPSRVLKSKCSRIIFCLMMVIGVHITAEVYCNSVNSQVFFGVFVVCYFFRDTDAIKQMNVKARKWINNVANILLIIACLSGLYGLVLFPWFVIRYGLKKRWEDKVSILLMSGPLVVQAITVFLCSMGGQQTTSRFFSFSMQAINNTIRFIVAVPLIGNKNAGEISIFAIYVFLALAIVGLFFVERKIKTGIIPQLIGIFIYYFFFVAVCGIGNNGAGGRYAVVPSSIMMLLVIGVFDNYKGRISKAISAVIICMICWFGMLEWHSPKNYAALDYNNAPSWENEVEEYKNNTSYDMKIWPYQKEWYISLDYVEEQQ